MAQAHVLKGSHSFTCTPCIHLLMEWTIPALTFPAKAGTHLPTPEGWKAELALNLNVGGYPNHVMWCTTSVLRHQLPSSALQFSRISVTPVKSVWDLGIHTFKFLMPT